jgi:hypothetical protein
VDTYDNVNTVKSDEPNEGYKYFVPYDENSFIESGKDMFIKLEITGFTQGEKEDMDQY